MTPPSSQLGREGGGALSPNLPEGQARRGGFLPPPPSHADAAQRGDSTPPSQISAEGGRVARALQQPPHLLSLLSPKTLTLDLAEGARIAAAAWPDWVGGCGDFFFSPKIFSR